MLQSKLAKLTERMKTVVTCCLTLLQSSKDMMVTRLKINPTNEKKVATPAITEESATEKIIIVSLSLKSSLQLPQVAPSSQQDKFSSSDIALTCDQLCCEVTAGCGTNKLTLLYLIAYQEVCNFHIILEEEKVFLLIKFCLSPDFSQHKLY